MNIRQSLNPGFAFIVAAFACAGTASAVGTFPDDSASMWPENLGSTFRLYHCHPTTAKNVMDSVMLWTDKGDKVLAVGAPLQRGRLPAYAEPIAVPATFGDPIRVAAKGYTVVSDRHGHTMKVGVTKLSCVPTSED
ncbi:MAG TPA: hypothetical protein VK996_04230 [Ramlibacter sp.]|nr:hypothetical protein [Ramlibacter sp.]